MWMGDPIVPSARHRIKKEKIHSKGPYQSHKLRTRQHDQDKTAMGSGDGETK